MLKRSVETAAGDRWGYVYLLYSNRLAKNCVVTRKTSYHGTPTTTAAALLVENVGEFRDPPSGSNTKYSHYAAVHRAAGGRCVQYAGPGPYRPTVARTPRVPAYASGLDIGLPDEELVTLYKRYADRGFTAANLKGGLDVVRDRQRLELVRDVLADAAGGARPALMLDGAILLGDRPGIGVEVDEAAIADRHVGRAWPAPVGPHVRPVRAGRRLVAEPHP